MSPKHGKRSKRPGGVRRCALARHVRVMRVHRGSAWPCCSREAHTVELADWCRPPATVAAVTWAGARCAGRNSHGTGRDVRCDHGFRSDERRLAGRSQPEDDNRNGNACGSRRVGQCWGGRHRGGSADPSSIQQARQPPGAGPRHIRGHSNCRPCGLPAVGADHREDRRDLRTRLVPPRGHRLRRDQPRAPGRIAIGRRRCCTSGNHRDAAPRLQRFRAIERHRRGRLRR